ncbi:MAG: ABC transporter ATP-binding protein [Spirochaetaceae bacterium]|jgi:putative spermidine/putrescine transport system ATP-binding protein|nr:ABC transporter ATP-binding protein [Spirochaetaceae bacterium]
MAYIQFENIIKTFDNETQALKGINLSVEKGELVTLLGPSGCGKSTLLRCLAGLESVSSGKIYLDNNDITDLSPKQREIGMVFQQYSLFPNMTVAQNVGFGLSIKRMEKALIREKVKTMLELVGLSEKLRQYPNQLSGGQQQRVALARALVMEPKVLLLDEPMSAIDALLRRNLQIEIRRIQRRLKITTIFVTHDQDEAMVMSDKIHLFNVGALEQSGVPTELYTKPRTKFAASFIGHYNILTASDFSAASGQGFDGEHVAIRPEVISVSAAAQGAQDGVIQIKGTVKGSIPHGNILRYTLSCGAVQLDADVLFDATRLFGENQDVYLSIPLEQVLPLQ